MEPKDIFSHFFLINRVSLNPTKRDPQITWTPAQEFPLGLFLKINVGELLLKILQFDFPAPVLLVQRGPRVYPPPKANQREPDSGLPSLVNSSSK